MQSINNLLEFLNQNWTAILICIGLLISIYKKTKEYLALSEDKKQAFVKTIIKEAVLDLVAKAEKDYAETSKAGAIKRSQVINQLYNDYPILGKISDQEAVIKLIDTEIDNALENVREVMR